MEIDLSKLEEVTGGDNNSLSDSLKIFIEQFEEFLENSKRIFSGKLDSVISDEVHKIKPSFYYVRIPELETLVSEFSSHSKLQSPDLKLLNNELEKIISLWNVVKSSLSLKTNS